MFRFNHFRQAISASKYSKTVLAVLLVGLLGSALIVGSGLQPATATAQPLACSGPASGVVDQQLTFTASGGNGSYQWSSAQSNRSGPTYTVAFPNPGDKTITLYSGTQTATCSVHISSGTGGGGGGGGSTAVSCSGPATLAPTQSGTFTASGGNGSYQWSSAQSNGSGPTYTVAFPNPGDKTITVTSGGQSGTCSVHVSSTLPPTPGAISCSGPATLNVNQSGTFTASGGSGSYHWVSAQSVADGASYTVAFPNPGQKTINITSGGQAGACSVNVVDNSGGNPTTCAPLQATPITVSGNTAQATATNLNPAGSNCPTETVNIASYKIYVAWNGSNNNEYLAAQRLFDNAQAVSVAPGQSRTLTVSLPNCQYQIDFFKGTQPKVPPFYGAELMTWVQNHTLPVCGDIVLPPTLRCSVNPPSARIGDPVSYSASGGNGAYSWSAPGGNPSTGSASVLNTSYNSTGAKYATVSSGGQTATCNVVIIQDEIPRLSCSPANQTVNVNQTATFVANGGTGAYSWSGGGTPATGSAASFNTSYSTAGTRTVTVTSGNQTATCNVTVNPVIDVNFFCSPSNQTVNVNQAANFAAIGGTAGYSWNASGGSPSTGSGANFSTSYGTSGNRSVTVTDGAGRTATCNVNVNPVVVNELSCTPNNQTVRVGNYASFSAVGGNGSYFWSAGNGNPSSGNGQNFTSQFFGQGAFNVTVSDGAGRSATCNVTVIQDFNPQYPSCSPSSQNANVNQQVTFYGNGGTGNFSWTAPNGQPVYGYGSLFTTSFSSPGQYNVTLNSNGQTATCIVNIQNNFSNAPFCSPSSQNANVNDFVSFTATGGNGSYFWNTASDGSPTSGSGSSFGTRFASPGTKFVTLNSNGLTSQCIVQIGGVLGASTVVTGPEGVAGAAAGLGFLGALGAYGAMEKEKAKKLIASIRSRFTR